VFEIDVEGLQELIDNALEMDRSIKRVTMTQLSNLGEFARYLCRVELEDVKYTGVLANSFVIVPDEARMRVQIYPTAKHGLYIRDGTDAHWAPIGPLKKWAARKLGDERAAYGVQRRIAGVVDGQPGGTSKYQLDKRGTMANPWPQRVVSRGDFQSALARTAKAAGRQIVAEFVE
jgi:hypothetical protein